MRSGGRLADADVTYRQLLELAPGFLFAREYLAKTLLAEGNAQEALAMLRQEHDEMERQKFLSIILQVAGRNTEADEALSALIVKFGDNEAYCVAMTYAYRGDHDLAFQWLDRAYRQKDDNLREIVGEPLFKNVADDPRYKAFLRKMNLPE